MSHHTSYRRPVRLTSHSVQPARRLLVTAAPCQPVDRLNVLPVKGSGKGTADSAAAAAACFKWNILVKSRSSVYCKGPTFAGERTCASRSLLRVRGGNFVAGIDADRVIYSKIIQEAGIKRTLSSSSRSGNKKAEEESLKSNLNPKFPAHIFLLVYLGRRREMEVRVE